MKVVEGNVKYVVKADFGIEETLFIAENGEPPVFSIDEARVFLTEKEAQSVVDHYNDTCTGNTERVLVWMVDEY